MVHDDENDVRLWWGGELLMIKFQINLSYRVKD